MLTDAVGTCAVVDGINEISKIVTRIFAFITNNCTIILTFPSSYTRGPLVSLYDLEGTLVAAYEYDRSACIHYSSKLFHIVQRNSRASRFN